MNPSVAELMSKMSLLQAQIATLQANVEWLTRLFWWLFALSGASVVSNGFIGTIVLRNNRSRSGGRNTEH